MSHEGQMCIGDLWPSEQGPRHYSLSIDVWVKILEQSGGEFEDSSLERHWRQYMMVLSTILTLFLNPLLFP